MGIPRRTAIGVDHNRVSLLAAVIDRVCGFPLASRDIFINVAGGVKVAEPAIDLAIVSSLTSSFLNRPVDFGTLVFGEVGLTGEVRGVGTGTVPGKGGGTNGIYPCSPFLGVWSGTTHSKRK